MNYGFLIRNDACIGCHACSTACKSENEVPLGVYRTWVKNVETGVFPSVRRHFQVTRCNHCANPPCVRICPVTAMYQRADGIVEFDPEVCIGCKACLQACPYDAIYVDPETGTAAKCHYCAHRVDLGLEPACVVVCPEHAIIAGDLDNPDSEISQLLAQHQVTVRKPEQGTAPKVFYVNGTDAALHPTATDRTPRSFAWADVLPLHKDGGGDGHHDSAGKVSPVEVPSRRNSASGAELRSPQIQGVPETGPIMIGDGRMAGQMVQVFYNAQHKIPWHWPVPAYLVTKGIGTGLFLLLSLGYGLHLIPFDALTFVVGGFLSLLFIAITTGLLVYDLERPERFLRIILRPQWKSWLVRGAYLMLGFSLVAGLWWLFETGAYLGWWSESVADTVRPVALWLGIPLATGVAVYTAFLFAQAEGRDAWQSALLPVHLLVQAFMAGAAVLHVAAFFISMPEPIGHAVRVGLVTTLVLDLLVLTAEFGVPHASEVAARTVHLISRGRYRRYFVWGTITVGHVVPLALLVVNIPLFTVLSGLLVIAGLYYYEYAFVTAPQEIPNS